MSAKDRLESLRDRFLAVSLRSRTLRLTRPSKSGAFDLTRLPPTRIAWLAKVLGERTDGPAPTGPIADVAADSPLSTDVAALAHAARTQRMETGSDDLAVGFPFLEGRAPDGTWLRAPLFLYPVALAQTTRGKLQWTLQPTGPAYLNTTLTETLGRLARVRLAEEDFAARDEDQLFKVDDATWRALLDTLRAAGLEVDAPASLPNAPSPLEPRDEAARNAQPAGRFSLRFHLVLGRFPASASTVVNDYEQLLSELEAPAPRPLPELLGPVGTALLTFDEGVAGGATELSNEGSTTSVPSSLMRWQVLPSDASQDEVFAFLERAQTASTPGLVVQGPPGTGKSQLITNVLAAMIARGDKVLLVCQKRAALDVVAERLERIGLAEPIAVVHDIQQDRGPLLQSIAQTLDEALAATSQDGGLQKLETGLARQTADLTRRLEGAQAAWEALTEEGVLPSLVELDEQLLSAPSHVLSGVSELARRDDFAQALSGVDLDVLSPDLDQAERLAPLAAPLSPPHVFADRTDWAHLDEAGLTAIRFRLQALDAALVAWAPHAHAPGLRNDVLDAHRALLADARPLAELAGDHDRRMAHALFLAWHGDVHGQEQLSRLRAAHETLPRVPVELVTRPRAEVEATLADLSKIEILRKKWWRVFLPVWWLLRGLPRRLVSGFGNPPRQLVDGDQVAGLIEASRHALAWQELLAELPEHPLFHLDGVGDPRFLEKPIAALERGFRVKRIEAQVRQALTSHGAPYTDPGGPGGVDAWRADEPPAIATAVAREHARAAAFDAVDRALAALRVDFGAELVDRLRADALLSPDTAQQAVRALIAAAPEMVRCRDLDRVLAGAPPWVRVFLRRFSQHPVGGSQPHAVDVRQSGRAAVLAGWLRMRLGERDASELERPLVDPKLTAALAESLAESKKLAGAAALAHYRARLTNKAKGQTELQRLLADVQKKRFRPTLRQLYERHGPALALARPIWFCSPEAVAALFPLVSSLFDLVIFDEASQCPVEAAIPALVRGRVAMVAGDDQQMPPSHFFAASLDDGDDDEDGEGALLAAQSILNLARVALPTTTLSWHYRCRHEELIAFSNTAFYGKKLATAPNAEGRARLQCEGLRWVAVDGRWKDQTNSAEADRVVELVAEILSESLPNGQPPTLGIVAMNRPQAELIERRLEARQASDEAFGAVLQRDLERPLIDQIFVRNLENVQGDERDIMILSLAYGPSEKGGKVAARFGPLGLDGGEKRLNVAITRARLGLTVVASCQPEDLSVENTTHPGPKLLKSFLAFVRATARGGLDEAKDLLERAAAQSGVAAPNKRLNALEQPGRLLAEALAKALDARGLVVARDIGLGRLSLDLAVRHPDEPTFRVALDTSGYLSRRDALLRDHHVPVFWQRVGWRILRVTPGAWRRDPAAVIRRIEDALNPAKGHRAKA